MSALKENEYRSWGNFKTHKLESFNTDFPPLERLKEFIPQHPNVFELFDALLHKMSPQEAFTQTLAAFTKLKRNGG